MIGKLTGTIDALSSDGLVIDVNGVGYVVHAGAKTLARLGPAGTAASLLIETQVREDAINLYGFADHAERDWFRLLVTVQGVGAKVGLSILSVLTPDDLATAILAQDKASVARANGVGPKLAQRIVTELKDKVGGMALGAMVKLPAGKSVNGGDNLMNDAVSALVNLGYRRAEAYGAVAKAIGDAGKGANLNDLIVSGLKELAQ